MHIHLKLLVNSLPNNKFLGRSELIAFKDKKIKVTDKLKFVLGRLKNIVGKGENADFQHFLLFPQFFQKVSFFKVGKSQDCVVKTETEAICDTLISIMV